jgi:hypothetical protein
MRRSLAGGDSRRPGAQPGYPNPDGEATVDREIGRVEELQQRQNPITIDCRRVGGKLSRMARSPNHERLVDQTNLVMLQDSQPQIVILGREHPLVKPAEAVE